MSIYKQELLDSINNSYSYYLPYQLKRVDSILYGILPATYTLLGSISGVGKTSFADHAYILQPYDFITKNETDIKFHGLYFSMERKLRYKLAKFTSWKLFHDNSRRITSDRILGFRKDRPLSTEEYDFIKSKQSWFDGLLELVDIQDGQKSVAEINQEIERLRKKLGVLFTSDDKHIYLDGIKKAEFGDSDLKSFTFRNKSYTIKKNSKLYIYNHPKTIVNIVVDHVGKTKLDGYKSKKEALDALDAVLSDARDIYGFTNIAISQFNRAISNIIRIKHEASALEPIVDDFKDTGNMVESADFVLSLFNPYKYKSYDTNGNYAGYSLTKGMLSPSGSQRFRSLHILKNSIGIENIVFGMKFLGEVMYFETLPRASEYQALQKVYESIATKGY